MFEQTIQANRTVDFTVSLYEDDGTTALVLAATDVVRFKLSRASTVILDLDTVAATANGSQVSVDTLYPAVVSVRLAQADTTSLQGAYSAEVAVVDDSETAPANAIKSCETGIVHVVPSASGDVGMT